MFTEFYSPDREFDHAEDCCLVGTPRDIDARLQEYAAAGLDQVIPGPAA